MLYNVGCDIFSLSIHIHISINSFQINNDLHELINENNMAKYNYVTTIILILQLRCKKIATIRKTCSA